MRVHHYGLEVIDMEESVAFYKKCLGFQEENRMFFLGEEIVFLVLGDFRLELVSGPRQQKNDKGAHICFQVSDLLDVMNRVDLNRKIEGPYKLQNGWEIVFYKGPNQEIIEFLQIRPV